MNDLRKPLSCRELEVARLVGKGWAYKDIGRKLDISHRTVQAHVNAIVTKIPWTDDNVTAYRRVAMWVHNNDQKSVA